LKEIFAAREFKEISPQKNINGHEIKIFKQNFKLIIKIIS